MHTLLQDLRYALRQMRLSPGFTTTAILTLAIGIGATTAIFTLVNAIMLKSLPVVEPSSLYRIGDTDECCSEGWEADDWSLFSYQLYHCSAEVHQAGACRKRRRDDEAGLRNQLTHPA
jgi:hypothetical protein